MIDGIGNIGQCWVVVAEVGYFGAIAFYGFVLVVPIGFEGFSEVVYIGIQQQGTMVQYAFLLLENVLCVA